MSKTFISKWTAVLFALAIVLGVLAVPVAHAASLTVSNTNDAGSGSLRQALADAQAGDTITFSSSLHGQTISLTSGQLTINKNLTISGPGASQLAISGGGLSRVFVVNTGVTATIQGLTIRDGSLAGVGGGIFNDGGILTVSNDTIMNNSANHGGGIFNAGELTINDSFLSGNSAIRSSGATNGAGGGVFNLGKLTVNNSTLSDNTAYRGGAAFNDSLGQMMVDHSTFSGNLATTSGGGISNFGILSVNNSTFDANTASEGGGISSLYFLFLENSTFSGNSAPSGGGGIYAANGSMGVTNSTFSSNSSGFGGGIYNATQNSYVINSTFSDNAGSGIFDDGGLTLVNTIVANSSSGPNCNSGDNGSGIGNLSWPDNTCPGSINADPKLLPLADNGGPTLTMALDVDSSAIDAGDNSGCPSTDQRGASRPVGARCDIGSYEAGSLAPTPTPMIETTTPVPTDTPLPTDTSTSTPVPADTATETLVPSATATGNLTGTPTPQATNTRRPTHIPKPTKTPKR